MTEPILTANGIKLRALSLRVSNVGVWNADVEPQEGALTGSCELNIGNTTLRGTVIEQQSGSFATRTTVRVVGGYGGWGKTLPPKHYHNDALVKAKLVAADLAREAGEQLGTFEPGIDRLGADYVRPRSLASHVLEHVAGGVPWWVDYAGVTHVSQRPSVELAADAYSLLDYDPASRVAHLAVDDVSALQIGSRLVDERLPVQQVVRDFTLQTRDNSPLRATAWCCDRPDERGRLATAMRAVVQRSIPHHLHGLYRYRVMGMAADGRVQVQAVRKDIGLPDVAPVPQWPGFAGLAANLAPGAEVLLAFIDGDPAQPVVAHYGGQGATGWVATSITLGGESGAPAARQGDAVKVLLPPAQFVGTINGLAAVGVVTWLLPEAQGVIIGGSGKVRVAT